ncbi:putative WRKY transcription factor 75 [Senna tora]|uniref:Putative WRKY transcription factor 75 n=1 Tax=Senna tora TaxID=362788 RepID=A0A834SDX9_9FABA|nr:putative WRKY transcription factor 75 [Senna tora]
MLFPSTITISSYNDPIMGSSYHIYGNNLEGQSSNGGRDGIIGMNNGINDDNNNNNSVSLDVIKDDDDDEKRGGGSRKKKGGLKVRKPRYAFQTRSQVDILDDGYRWRKYGQKAVKNNKFPRSYYRCTHQGCNVKKQVQRLTKDEGVVVTTYEGIHTHPIDKTTDNFENILTQMHIYSNTITTPPYPFH